MQNVWSPRPRHKLRSGGWTNKPCINGEYSSTGRIIASFVNISRPWLSNPLTRTYTYRPSNYIYLLRERTTTKNLGWLQCTVATRCKDGGSRALEATYASRRRVYIWIDDQIGGASDGRCNDTWPSGTSTAHPNLSECDGRIR